MSRLDALAQPRERGSPVQYFGADLELELDDPRLMKPGTRVRATILVDERPAAVLVPRQAVFDRAGNPIVYRR